VVVFEQSHATGRLSGAGRGRGQGRGTTYIRMPDSHPLLFFTQWHVCYYSLCAFVIWVELCVKFWYV